MRKTQVALAALALVASTAALADGVTVYGTLDASMVSSNNGGGSNFSGPGQWGANVIGFRGTTEVANGMKASFNLEGGFSSAHGGNSNGGTTNLFNRAANVGLSGGFGTVTAGVQVSPFIASSGSALALAGNNFVVPALVNSGTIDGNSAAGSATTTGGFFISNAISYANSFGPVSFSVLTASKGTNGGASFEETNQYLGGNVSYSDGGLYLTAAMADRNNTYKSVMVGGSYTMDQMKFAGQVHDYQAGTSAIYTSDRKTYILSASYALSGSTTVGVNYVNTDVAGAATLDPKLTNISLLHSLGKSTSVYAFVGNGKGGSGVSYGAAVPTGSIANGVTSAYGIGINHNF